MFGTVENVLPAGWLANSCIMLGKHRERYLVSNSPALMSCMSVCEHVFMCIYLVIGCWVIYSSFYQCICMASTV